jgi:hypothetical protein
MPMSKASELQWCKFLTKVLRDWPADHDICQQAVRHRVPVKRVEKVAAWASREGVIKATVVKPPYQRIGYVVDYERALAAIQKRERRVRGEPEPVAKVDWQAFELMWRGVVANSQRLQRDGDGCNKAMASLQAVKDEQE